MALHLIPDDGDPHAPTTECGCGVRVIRLFRPDGSIRRAYAHGLALDDEDADALEHHVFRTAGEGYPTGH